MEHNRNGTDFGFPRIRGKTRDDPGRQRRKLKKMHNAERLMLN